MTQCFCFFPWDNPLNNSALKEDGDAVTCWDMNSIFSQHIEGRRVISRLLFVVCLFLCSAEVMHGQRFVEQVGVFHDSNLCDVGSSTKLKVFCSASWVSDVDEGYGKAVAANGFGNMRAYAYSSLTTLENDITDSDAAAGTEGTNDNLSILGLNGQKAFLRLTFECLQCPLYVASGYTPALYMALAARGRTPDISRAVTGHAATER
jgi:hypothetical protein